MNLSLILDLARASHGERIGLGSRRTGITYSDLAAQAAGGAAVLRQRGTELVFIGQNGPAFPQLLFAAAMAGVPFSPLNYRLSAEQIGQLIDQFDDPVLVVDDSYLPLIAGRDRMTTAEFLAMASNQRDTGSVGAAEGGEAAVVLFTSGTTSQPKAVVLRHENLFAYIMSTTELTSATADEAALVAVPPYHVAAVASVLSNLYAGRRVVYLPDFDAAEWLRLVREEEVTSAMVVPTMLARIVDHIGGGTADTPSLKTLSYGGARTPRPVLEEALRAFPATGMCNAYGLTETSSTLALLGPEDHRAAIESSDPSVRRRLGSIGRPVPGVEIRICDDDRHEVGEGETGELWVRGQQISGVYRSVGSVLDDDGWFPTRDLASQDADGFLYIEGRKDDTIIRGGENIAPAEIEDVLILHPAVKDVAVIGAPDDEWGEKLVAVVVRAGVDELDGEHLRGWVRERLRGSRTPDEVVWRDSLPRNPMGKLLRRELMADLVAAPTGSN